MIMRKIQYLFIALFICLEIQAQDKFNIRGVLPWHNFLSGPTSWNLSDYRIYLDECRKNGINFIGFHNYTGGGERYATYVEPMIKIEYKNTKEFILVHTSKLLLPNKSFLKGSIDKIVVVLLVFIFCK